MLPTCATETIWESKNNSLRIWNPRVRTFITCWIPFLKSFYSHPSANLAWTIGGVLYHITLGPPAIRFEISMLRYTPWMFKLLTNSTSRLFNWGNALLARAPARITRQTLEKAYEKGHTGLMSSLKRMRELDFARTVTYPPEFVSELAGEVSIERLFRYVTLHFEVHEGQIQKAINHEGNEGTQR
ncbi:MAG: hypothetical protein QM730_20445 [Anaerolineales bacterium]